MMSASGRLRVQRFRKDFIVKMMTRQLEGKNFVAVAYTGNINYHQQYTLRSDLNAAGASFNIVKNSLMALGFERAGFEPLKPLLRGKVAIASGDADVAIAKTLLSLSKKVPDFTILGAMLNQSLLLQYDEVDRLAKLPPAEIVHRDLIAQMMPGTLLQVPNVAAYLVALMQQHSSSPNDSGSD